MSKNKKVILAVMSLLLVAVGGFAIFSLVTHSKQEQVTDKGVDFEDEDATPFGEQGTKAVNTEDGVVNTSDLSKIKQADIVGLPVSEASGVLSEREVYEFLEDRGFTDFELMVTQYDMDGNRVEDESVSRDSDEKHPEYRVTCKVGDSLCL